jgi:hypothetical protein
MRQQLPILTHLLLNLVGRLLTLIPNSNNIELPSLEPRRRCPIDAGVEVNLLNVEFDFTIVTSKPMTP